MFGLSKNTPRSAAMAAEMPRGGSSGALNTVSKAPEKQEGLFQKAAAFGQSLFGKVKTATESAMFGETAAQKKEQGVFGKMLNSVRESSIGRSFLGASAQAATQMEGMFKAFQEKNDAMAKLSTTAVLGGQAARATAISAGITGIGSLLSAVVPAAKVVGNTLQYQFATDASLTRMNGGEAVLERAKHVELSKILEEKRVQAAQEYIAAGYKATEGIRGTFKGLVEKIPSKTVQSLAESFLGTPKEVVTNVQARTERTFLETVGSVYMAGLDAMKRFSEKRIAEKQGWEKVNQAMLGIAHLGLRDAAECINEKGYMDSAAQIVASTRNACLLAMIGRGVKVGAEMSGKLSAAAVVHQDEILAYAGNTAQKAVNFTRPVLEPVFSFGSGNALAADEAVVAAGCEGVRSSWWYPNILGGCDAPTTSQQGGGLTGDAAAKSQLKAGVDSGVKDGSIVTPPAEGVVAEGKPVISVVPQEVSVGKVSDTATPVAAVATVKPVELDHLMTKGKYETQGAKVIDTPKDLRAQIAFEADHPKWQGKSMEVKMTNGKNDLLMRDRQGNILTSAKSDVFGLVGKERTGMRHVGNGLELKLGKDHYWLQRGDKEKTMAYMVEVKEVNGKPLKDPIYVTSSYLTTKGGVNTTLVEATARTIAKAEAVRTPVSALPPSSSSPAAVSASSAAAPTLPAVYTLDSAGRSLVANWKSTAYSSDARIFVRDLDNGRIDAAKVNAADMVNYRKASIGGQLARMPESAQAEVLAYAEILGGKGNTEAGLLELAKRFGGSVERIAQPADGNRLFGHLFSSMSDKNLTRDLMEKTRLGVLTLGVGNNSGAMLYDTPGFAPGKIAGAYLDSDKINGMNEVPKWFGAALNGGDGVDHVKTIDQQQAWANGRVKDLQFQDVKVGFDSSFNVVISASVEVATPENRQIMQWISAQGLFTQNGDVYTFNDALVRNRCAQDALYQELAKYPMKNENLMKGIAYSYAEEAINGKLREYYNMYGKNTGSFDGAGAAAHLGPKSGVSAYASFTLFKSQADMLQRDHNALLGTIDERIAKELTAGNKPVAVSGVRDALAKIGVQTRMASESPLWSMDRLSEMGKSEPDHIQFGTKDGKEVGIYYGAGVQESANVTFVAVKVHHDYIQTFKNQNVGQEEIRIYAIPNGGKGAQVLDLTEGAPIIASSSTHATEHEYALGFGLNILTSDATAAAAATAGAAGGAGGGGGAVPGIPGVGGGARVGGLFPL